ncbi:MAG: response regulator [Desulfobulbaceae bacterium]|nr:response regulator [Desulfobulbaceae bacterium]
MSSIALFYNTFTEEKEIREQLAAASGYQVIQDMDIIDEICKQYDVTQDKVERTLYGPVSVFNKFTMERERITAQIKLALVQHLESTGIIYSGYIALLIPSEAQHVLRVGLFDQTSNRLQRAMAEGLTERNGVKLIRKNDASATGWADFVHDKAADDASLYDIVIPVGSGNAESAVELIMKNYLNPAVLENEESKKIVTDVILATRVEQALVDSGYTVEVKSNQGKITLLINKSVFNFSKHAETLTIIARDVIGVQEVEVTTGKDYHVSIYRDQEFTLPPKVLLVDDEQEYVQTLSERLNTRNYGSYPVFDGEQALEFLDNEVPDVMVLDLKMPGMGGIEVLQKTKEANPEIEIIVLTGHGSEEDRKICIDLGAYAYLHKPVDIKELTSLIDKAHEKVAAAKIAHA